MLMIFIELNDLWLYFYYNMHVGDYWRMIWVDDAYPIQFNDLRKIWGLISDGTVNLGIVIHGLLEKQLEIDLYASVSCVENDPLASPSSI